MSIFRTKANPKYLGLDNKDPVSFSNNTGIYLKVTGIYSTDNAVISTGSKF